MKKIICLIFLSFAYMPLFSQVLQYLSMGYNTSDNQNIKYYFYGYDDYSEGIIWKEGNVALSTRTAGYFIPDFFIGSGYYPLSVYYDQYQGQNNTTGYSAFLGATNDQGLEYKFDGERLVYWAYTMNFRPIRTMNRFERTNKGIIIYANRVNGGQEERYEYYNIPRTELLDIFLESYVKTICCSIVNNVDAYKGNFIPNSDRFISTLLEARTARELAIFRNCMFAMKGYRFSTQSWTDFFNKYLNGYNGTRTNDQVMAMFTENERWLLDLIIQYENRR